MTRPADPRDARTAAILAATRHWLTRAVIGLNLCPFAKSVYVKEQIRYTISAARDFSAVLSDLEHELQWLAEADPQQIDTTLLILPDALADFTEYNDMLYFADRLLQQLKLSGTLQIASFHPDYQFEGSSADQIENYTNRAPYPMLHLLREQSIERAVAAFPDAADIYEKNQVTLRQLGHAGWQALMRPGGED